MCVCACMIINELVIVVMETQIHSKPIAIL